MLTKNQYYQKETQNANGCQWETHKATCCNIKANANKSANAMNNDNSKNVSTSEAIVAAAFIVWETTNVEIWRQMLQLDIMGENCTSRYDVVWG